MTTRPYRSPVIRQVLDLTVYAWRQQHGDLTVYGTWYLGDAEGPWPCMVIVPTYRTFTQSYVPCVVSIDLAWIWSEEEGDPEYAAETAISFADTLGIGANPQNVFRIASIVRDHIADLIKIGPRPAEHKKIVADALLKDENGRERHTEIRDDV